MLLLRQNKPITDARRGFTLVEMLVVAPIAILSIAAIVALSISVVGDALISQDRATTAYTIQESLDRIEQDVRVSNSFLTGYSNLLAGQGKNATSTLMTDTTAFTATTNGTVTDTLILDQTATTSDPFDSSRTLVYYNSQPYTCGASSAHLNRTLQAPVIYFLRNDNDGNGNVLWRRVIVPIWNTNAGASMDADSVCAAPWQRDTCPKVNANCQAVDEKLINNVTAFTLAYYTATGTSVADGSSANSVKILLTTTKTIAGASTTSSGTLRVTRINEGP